MKVSTWYGSGIYGVRVGPKNRENYFDPAWETIIVVLDGQEYTFKLTDGFWNECPEFRESKDEPVIKNWLLKYRTLNWPNRQTPKMELIPIEPKKFKLVP
ncbi:hypothetical protein MHM89_05465 [Pseudoalteromonas sp. CNC9-20]|uniref:hypothetical protein n=1 Tax=Pseudoalteromonas sp. CNC9-20 TaxID=2917750 RepID=UPI001EF6FCE8|nr:hypothetical protein [Pseudoalteromonas sp. CNC9-20]MCG7569374.1 hypothetical protein [Pseudoalteromonas sp. CNC9-20]